MLILILIVSQIKNDCRKFKVHTVNEFPSLNLWIKLNIGGIKYETSAGTLLNEKLTGPNCLFRRLLSKKYPKDDDGYLCIDRNGKYFEPLLDYLRTGDFVIPSHLSTTCVLREAAYFKIDLPPFQVNSNKPESKVAQQYYVVLNRGLLGQTGKIGWFFADMSWPSQLMKPNASEGPEGIIKAVRSGGFAIVCLSATNSGSAETTNDAFYLVFE